LRIQLTYWRLLRQLNPAIIIISAPELLPVSILHKLLHKSHIWYDVRENYFLNLTTQHTYPFLVRYALACSIRFLEYITAPFISEYLLAETSYAAELPFIRKKYIILQNKYTPLYPHFGAAGPFPKKIYPPAIRLLYSGTISEIHGIFAAIQLVDRLHQRHPGFSLTIIGYCAVASTWQQVQQAVQHKPYITVIGGNHLVPHAQIVEYIQQSNLGLLPYLPHPSTFTCVPTKLFEYLANGLPVLVQENPNWTNLVNRYEAGISIDFATVNIENLITHIFQKEYYPAGISPEMFWETEETQLIQLGRKYKLG
jgi:glycosyltransferase involved in cell wall biosynthesis